MAMINCPECGKLISDKAKDCPNCGYPLRLRFAVKRKNSDKQISVNRMPENHIRRANGTGSISKLSGNRRKPFCARRTIGFNNKNYPIYKVIGYYETYKEAEIALEEYNKNESKIRNHSFTFSELYKLFFDTIDNYSQDILSESRIKSLEYAYKKCQKIYDVPIRLINGELLRQFFMESKMSVSQVSSIKSLINILVKFGKEINALPSEFSPYSTHLLPVRNNNEDYSDIIDSELNRIDTMPGLLFEYWCADLIKKNGYVNVSVTRASGDQGVDIIAEKDDIRFAIQCKCHSHDLGNKPIQEINAGKAVYNCQIGIVMTNRGFTEGAKAVANVTGTLLWDREKLVSMMQKALLNDLQEN